MKKTDYYKICNQKLKYRVVKNLSYEFGKKSKVFTIEKRTIFGVYWPMDGYYFDEEAAQTKCNELNRV